MSRPPTPRDARACRKRECTPGEPSFTSVSLTHSIPPGLSGLYRRARETKKTGGCKRAYRERLDHHRLDPTRDDLLLIAGVLERVLKAEVMRRFAMCVETWRHVSPHWMRRGHGSHAPDRGAPLHLVQATPRFRRPAATRMPGPMAVRVGFGLCSGSVALKTGGRAVCFGFHLARLASATPC